MKLRLATVLTILALVVGCGGMKTTTDFDHDADFSQYSTYAWHDGTSSDIQDSDPLNLERLISAIDAQTQQHGFQKITANPDVYITYHGEDKTQTYLYGWRLGLRRRLALGRHGHGGDGLLLHERTAIHGGYDRV